MSPISRNSSNKKSFITLTIKIVLILVSFISLYILLYSLPIPEFKIGNRLIAKSLYYNWANFISIVFFYLWIKQAVDWRVKLWLLVLLFFQFLLGIISTALFFVFPVQKNFVPYVFFIFISTFGMFSIIQLRSSPEQKNIVLLLKNFILAPVILYAKVFGKNEKKSD